MLHTFGEQSKITTFSDFGFAALGGQCLHDKDRCAAPIVGKLLRMLGDMGLRKRGIDYMGVIIPLCSLRVKVRGTKDQNKSDPNLELLLSLQ